MDLHIRAGKTDGEVKKLFKQSTNRDSVSFGMLIKSYGKHDRAKKATRQLCRMLNHSRNRPNAALFATTIDAWAESSDTDALEQAFEVFSLMEKQGIVADVVVFGSLMKVIAKSTSDNAGREAEALLEAMKKRRVEPNIIVYNSAISACYQAKDFDRAERIMNRMEHSSTPPDLRTYSEILSSFAKRGTPEAAQRCESILLEHMKALAKSSPELRPNAHHFSIVIMAWSRSNAPYLEITDRMWKLYEQMVADGIECDSVSYNQLIGFLSKSRKERDLARADGLLRTMEEDPSGRIRPDALNYFAVMKGMLLAIDRLGRC